MVISWIGGHLLITDNILILNVLSLSNLQFLPLKWRYTHARLDHAGPLHNLWRKEMSKTVSEVFVETLSAAGIKRVYGVVGDSLNGLTEAIRTSEHIDLAARSS
ncbi:MAG: poxB [Planctomycetaceae bacterium]|nr:poxB [Planctomycetaceae bacterium]